MNLGKIIENQAFFAKPDDTLKKLLAMMDDAGVQYIPIIEEEVYLGLTSVDTLSLLEGDQSLKEAHVSYKQAYLYEGQHIFDAIPFFEAHEVDILPILTSKQRYLGLVTPLDLLAALNNVLGNQQPGGIIVLEAGVRDNALSHLAHIIESTDTQILSTNVRKLEDSTKIEITIKVNTNNLSAVISALLRYDYVIKTTFSSTLDQKNINDRFDQLMNYINM